MYLRSLLTEKLRLLSTTNGNPGGKFDLKIGVCFSGSLHRKWQLIFENGTVFFLPRFE